MMMEHFAGGSFRRRREQLGLFEKIKSLNIGLIGAVMAVGMIGCLGLYSAANGSFEPYASRHIIRFIVGLILMLGVALVDIRLWRSAAYPFYVIALCLLILVDLKGYIGMGAQRWVDLGFIRLQPSEIMKVALVMALARFFDKKTAADLNSFSGLWPVFMMTVLPVILVLNQPDLGTAIMISALGAVMLFIAGLSWKLIFIAVTGFIAAVPLAWNMLLKSYQKNRILTFLNPESDPLGAGYHVTQSKIALGSGGITGKGFLEGTQSHLNFLPEKQTDFIFTLIGEEWGLIGGLTILFFYLIIFGYGNLIAVSSRNSFGRLLAIGLSINLMLYVMINTGMVMGLLPVVGVPLPMISYGGTAMLTVMFSLGLILSVSIYRHARLNSVF